MTVMTSTAIFRYPLKVTYYQTFSVPTKYKILSCAPARVGYGIDLWAKVSPRHRDTTVAIYILGTGHPWPSEPFGGDEQYVQTLDLDFVGTCVMDDGLVWHVFTGPVHDGI
jgi:hypothetical protein